MESHGGKFAGRVAVVTGGTSGIGEAAVRRFAASGASVVFCGRSAEAGHALASTLGGGVRFVRADVTHEDEIAGVIEEARTTFGRVDCLFNNAGGPAGGQLETVTQADFRHAMDLLLGSVIFGMKHAAPVMKQQGYGRIINNSSVAAVRAGLGGYLYSAAKAGVTHVTRLAAVDLAPHGITVNTVSPGAIATPIFYGGSEAGRSLDPEHEAGKMKKLLSNLAASTPANRAGLPEDIASAVLFLAAEDAAHINGHDLVVDAGMVAAPPRMDGRR